jgi:hypothetical protein
VSLRQVDSSASNTEHPLTESESGSAEASFSLAASAQLLQIFNPHATDLGSGLSASRRFKGANFSSRASGWRVHHFRDVL